jgi:prepilin-type N-terminal cleavage/methylation domain-containing protein
MSRIGARRLAREESGFTLPEMMVTMVIMIVVLFALYSIFDMSIRVFSFGNDKVDAVENARLGLEKMEREIRAAFPRDKANGQNHLFWVYNNSSTSQLPQNPPTAPGTSPGPITFGNDLNGNDKIAGDEATESISYYLENGVLKRSINGGVGQAVAESVEAEGFKLHRYNSIMGTGCPKRNASGELVAEATVEADIRVVCVSLTVNVNGRSQTLVTDVALRNRG